MQRHNKTSIEPYLAESNKSATSLVFSAEEVIHVQHRRVHEVFYYGLLNRPLVFLRQMKSAAAEAWNRVTYDTGTYLHSIFRPKFNKFARPSLFSFQLHPCE